MCIYKIQHKQRASGTYKRYASHCHETQVTKSTTETEAKKNKNLTQRNNSPMGKKWQGQYSEQKNNRVGRLLE